jgi:hypothetical protein
VDFNKFNTGRTFLGLTALDLNNMTQDASNIRVIMAMKFYRAMGIPAPRASMAAVYVNNEYQGLHFMVEEIDEASLTRLVGENTGYLFEYKWTFYYYMEYLGSDLAAYAALYEPKTRTTESVEALYGPVEAFLRAVNSAEDDDFVDVVSEYLDLGAFVRLVAVQAFLGERDGMLGGWGINNHYLYRFNQRNLHQFIPWDASNAFYLIDFPIDFNHDLNVLMRRIMAVPELRALYVSTVLEAAALADQVSAPSSHGPVELSGLDRRPGEATNGVFAAASTGQAKAESVGYLEYEIARFQALIREAAYADTLKPFTNAEFDADSAFMIQFAQQRSAIVRSLLERLAVTTGDVATAPLTQPRLATPDAGRRVPIETAPPLPPSERRPQEAVAASEVPRESEPAIAAILISNAAADGGSVRLDKPSLDRTAPKLVVTVEVAGARGGSVVSVSVTYLGNNGVLDPLNSEIAVDDDGFKEFSFTNTAKEWPAGAYRVTATASDGSRRTKDFRIE